MKKYIFIIAFGSAIILSSCTYSRYIYTASPANNPYFTDKGQSKLTAYYSNNSNEVRGSGNDNNKSKANGFDLQSAYAISKNWALTAGFYHRNETELENYENWAVKYKRNLFDVGGGAFIPLNKEKSLTFNVFGGMAFGKFSFTDQSIPQGYDRFHSAVITKWYVQPSFNYIANEYMRIGFILKYSFVYYGNIQTDYSNEEKVSLGLDLVENKSIPFFEPELNVQFGLEELPWVKLDLVTSSASSIIYQIQNIGSVRSSNVSIGLTFDLTKMKKKNR